jgi:hypothetical protein
VAKLKQSYGWFAAGREVRQAMELLSDGAFKLYMHVCLYADRETGSLLASLPDLVQVMKRSPDAIHGYLEEMRQKGVCRSPNTEWSDGFQVEICDPYWPYHRNSRGKMITQPQIAFAEQIRSLLAARRCVEVSFTPAEDKLAASLFEQGISLEQVRRAILLGCARKCTAIGNGAPSYPIRSLRYFWGSIEEVTSIDMGPEYWRYVEVRLNALEAQWLKLHKQDNDARDEMMKTK